MTQNRRILLNVLATYGRSLFAMCCGIFSSRWVLMSLGEVDYGLFGLVGGLTAFISFFNGLLALAVSRFYAVSVGRAQLSNDDDSLEDCRRWFSIAVLIHAAVPFFLLMIGYPLGSWAIEHFFTIPSERVHDCIWVFRFVCLSCFVAMVNVPFTAMYTAKQYIAELTIYSFCSTALNVAFLYFMVEHPGEWLARYALWTSLLSVVPQLIICLRAVAVFPECRFRLGYCRDSRRIGELLCYAGWQFWGALGALLRGQGITILVNKYFGPNVNASFGIANTVNAQASTLSSALVGAFSPAITTAYGAGDLVGMRKMALRSCKFGAVLVLLFLLPLSVELDTVMHVWLKRPPPYVVGLCIGMMVLLVLDKCTTGHMIALNARGKIALYQAVVGGLMLLTVPVAWMAVALGLGVYSIVWAMVLVMFFAAWGRVLFASRLVGISAKAWLCGIMFPLAFVCFASLAVMLAVVISIPASLSRVALTTVLGEGVFLPLSWRLVLDEEEKAVVRNKIAQVMGRLGMGHASTRE